ncbi:MAG: Fic family protein [Candidatus Methanoplasma sp.]|jgi:Fic family protein|nr:Fic family protein [Candidatus Methanoplasma sp.]
MPYEYSPPFTISDRAIGKISDISEKLGLLDAARSSPDPRLRRANRIRSIRSSLAIANNSLTLEQAASAIDGKHVLGPPQDILEAKNAFAAYGGIGAYDPYAAEDLLDAHLKMTGGVVSDAGRFRPSRVGVFRGKKVVYIAPPAGMVPKLTCDLLSWARRSEAHPLIKSCVFHYEFEFIHPFSDGNGRMGRLWHTLLLSRWKPLFEWIPTESMLEKHQKEYYDAISGSTENTDSGIFIDFMLGIINDALDEFMTDQETDQETDHGNIRARRVADCLSGGSLPASEIMAMLGLSHRQTFRDNYLRPAMELGLVEMTHPENPKNRNQRYRLGSVIRPTQ